MHERGWWCPLGKPWSYWGMGVLPPRHAGKPAAAITWSWKQADTGPGSQGREQCILRKGWSRPHSSAPQRGPSPAPPRRAFQTCRVAGSLGLVQPGCTNRMLVCCALPSAE